MTQSSVNTITNKTHRNRMIKYFHIQAKTLNEIKTVMQFFIQPCPVERTHLVKEKKEKEKSDIEFKNGMFLPRLLFIQTITQHAHIT